jgi:hypothetical protein
MIFHVMVIEKYVKLAKYYSVSLLRTGYHEVMSCVSLFTTKLFFLRLNLVGVASTRSFQYRGCGSFDSRGMELKCLSFDPNAKELT